MPTPNTSIGQRIIQKIFILPEGFRVNFFFLRFEKNLEKKFMTQYFEDSLVHIRFSMIASMIFYGLFGFLDYLVLPELIHRFLFIRFIMVIPISLVIFILSYSKQFQKYYQPLLSFLIFLAGLGIVLMIYYGREYPESLVPTTYYTGLILVFIFAYNFVRLRFWWASFASWMIVLSYEIMVLAFMDLNLENFILINFFFITGNLIGMFSSYLYELSQRKSFYFKNLLNEEKEKVDKINLHLEERVLHRTKDLEKATKKAVESDQLKSEFLANISHEIRTPMNGIIGFTTLLSKSDLSLDKRKTYLNIINEKGLDLIEILNNIIAISMIESNSTQLNESDFELNSNLLNLHDSLSESFTDSSIKFKLDIPVENSKIKIKTDRIKFEQIINNLVINALKYAQHGEVILGYKIKKKGLRIFVSDTGVGIPKQFKPYVFTSFSKNESKKKEFKKGTGLGLAICKGLADLMGAKISFKSIMGKGTTFYLDFPIDIIQQTELN